MPLPTDSEILGLNLSMDGSPWCHITTKASIHPAELEISLDGSPWGGAGISGYRLIIKGINYIVGIDSISG